MQDPDQTTEVLVAYYSRSGVLQQLANQIMEGVLRVPAAEASLLAVDDVAVEQLQQGDDEQAMALRRAAVISRLTAADALIVGAPAYFGSTASPIKRLYEDWMTAAHSPIVDHSRPWLGHHFRDKVGAAFTAPATADGGNEETLNSILTMLMHMDMVIVTSSPGDPILEHANSPYGATAAVGPNCDREPSRQELEAARVLGERVARIAGWLHMGQVEWEKQRQLQPSGQPA